MPTSTRSALPVQAKQVIAQRTTGGKFDGQLDITALGVDGRIYHAWFEVGVGWHGWEPLSDAG